MVIDRIVFGTGGLEGQYGEKIIREAFEAGFRVFDSATAYGNEKTVGLALSDVRDRVQIITKIRGEDHGYLNTIRAVEKSLLELNIECIDFFLIHWPLPHKKLYLETFEALLAMQQKGFIKEVGVSNFNINHLEEIFKNFGKYPFLNQVELHPYFQQEELRNFHNQKDIKTLGWSSLNKNQRGILEDPIICDIARTKCVSPAQIILAFEQSLGVIPVVKSKNQQHMIDNCNSKNIQLFEKEIQSLMGLDRGWRRGGDPAYHDE